MDDRPRGYIAIHRKITESWVWSLTWPQRGVLLEILFRARWSEKPYRHVTAKGTVVLQRGQYLTSTRKLAEACGVSKNTVTRTLKILERELFLVRHSEGQLGELLTVCNYERYQNPNGDPGTPMGTPAGTPVGTPAGTRQNQGRKRRSIQRARQELWDRTPEPERETYLRDARRVLNAHGALGRLPVPQAENAVLEAAQRLRERKEDGDG